MACTAWRRTGTVEAPTMMSVQLKAVETRQTVTDCEYVSPSAYIRGIDQANRTGLTAVYYELSGATCCLECLE